MLNYEPIEVGSLFWKESSMGSQDLVFPYRAIAKNEQGQLLSNKNGDVSVYNTIHKSLDYNHGIHAGSIDWVNPQIYEAKRKEALEMVGNANT